jgi:hypothetical protein
MPLAIAIPEEEADDGGQQPEHQALEPDGAGAIIGR